MRDMVEENGGIHNTLAMESLDKGYKDCTPEEKNHIDQIVAQRETQLPIVGSHYDLENGVRKDIYSSLADAEFPAEHDPGEAPPGVE